MRRFVRLLAPLALAAGIAAPMSAHATDTLAWTFHVPCNSSAGDSTPAGIGLPTGTYAVTVSGACILNFGSTSVPVGGTPCTVPVVGSVPCTSPITTVNNVPWFTLVSTGGGNVITTAPSESTTGCGVFYMTIDGQCFASQAGTYNRAISGPMTVAFVDFPGTYGDNVGELAVTVTWTAL
jgi:hypothetical protein